MSKKRIEPDGATPIESEHLAQKDLFRVDEVASYFEVSERTVRLWIEHGHLQVEKLGGSLRVIRSSILGFRLRSRGRIS